MSGCILKGLTLWRLDWIAKKEEEGGKSSCYGNQESELRDSGIRNGQSGVLNMPPGMSERMKEDVR